MIAFKLISNIIIYILILFLLLVQWLGSCIRWRGNLHDPGPQLQKCQNFFLLSIGGHYLHCLVYGCPGHHRLQQRRVSNSRRKEKEDPRIAKIYKLTVLPLPLAAWIRSFGLSRSPHPWMSSLRAHRTLFSLLVVMLCSLRWWILCSVHSNSTRLSTQGKNWLSFYFSIFLSFCLSFCAGRGAG